MTSLTLPKSATELRALLGDGFVIDFSGRLESLGIDVIHVPGLSTAYSFEVGEHPVVAVGTTGNWFYVNWSIAHELGHLCLGHKGVLPDSPGMKTSEAQANAFAAELLLPADLMQSLDWSRVDNSSVANFLWETGVSTTALRSRLQHLNIPLQAELAEDLELSTQKFLKRFWDAPSGDPITERMGASAQRHFPQWLKSAHLDRIAEGKIRKDSLAWMLGVDPNEIEVAGPREESGMSEEDYLDDLLEQWLNV